jgi:hypothetical protein
VQTHDVAIDDSDFNEFINHDPTASKE